MAIKRSRKAKAVEEEEELDMSPATSKADLFDEEEVKDGFTVDFPLGEHVVIIESIELKKNNKGEAVVLTYAGVEGEAEGKTISQYYSMFDADGNTGKGIGFLKRDLQILGYESVRYTQLEEVFGEIVDESVEVTIQVKENKGYMNAYLQHAND